MIFPPPHSQNRQDAPAKSFVSAIMIARTLDVFLFLGDLWFVVYNPRRRTSKMNCTRSHTRTF